MKAFMAERNGIVFCAKFAMHCPVRFLSTYLEHTNVSESTIIFVFERDQKLSSSQVWLMFGIAVYIPPVPVDLMYTEHMIDSRHLSHLCLFTNEPNTAVYKQCSNSANTDACKSHAKH